MSEEEKKDIENEEKSEEETEETVDQEKLAEEWAKMAEAEKNKEEKKEEIDQKKLAEEWAKMAEAGEEKSKEIDQEELAKEWEKMAQVEEETADQEKLAEEWAKIAEAEKKKEVVGLDQEKLDLLMDIPLEVSVEIGSTHLPLEEILKLNPNNIVELDKFINQPVDLKVNGKLIARGELYTVEDHFGIKITSIITVHERMKLLTEEES